MRLGKTGHHRLGPGEPEQGAPGMSWYWRLNGVLEQLTPGQEPGFLTERAPVHVQDL